MIRIGYAYERENHAAIFDFNIGIACPNTEYRVFAESKFVPDTWFIVYARSASSACCEPTTFANDA